VYGHHVAAGGYDVDDWLSLWCSSSLCGMHETLIHVEVLNEGRLSKETKELNVTHDTKVLEKGGTNEEPVSAAGNTGVSSAVPEVSTTTPMTPPTTKSVFEDEDIFLADALVMLSDKTKLKGVAIKEVKEFDRPERFILTLKPLQSIDPKDKGKRVLKESPVKKAKRGDLDDAQIEKDAEVARLLYEEELAEIEREKVERQRQEQASMDYIANLYDEVQARVYVDHELAVRWTHEEQEKYTMDERAKLLAEFFERRKKRLAEERVAAIRNKPPTRTQLRSLMMTYLKHTGRFKHSQLNKRTFEEIQALYIKEQERATDFMPIGSEEDERQIQKMNKKVASVHEEKLLEEPDSTKIEDINKKAEGESTNKEEEQLKAFLNIVHDDEKEVNYEVLDKRYPIVDWNLNFIILIDMENLITIIEFLELMEVQDISRLSLKWFRDDSEVLTAYVEMMMGAFDKGIRVRVNCAWALYNETGGISSTTWGNWSLDTFEVHENEVFQGMQLIQKLRDDQKCMKKFKPSSRSKATKDIISIGSFVEVLVFNHYVLIKKILGKLSKLQDEDAQNKTNIQEPQKLWWWKFKRC
ncbi:hypothetical protein Tco_1246619, partial [Tanacetum coccineum]